MADTSPIPVPNEQAHRDLHAIVTAILHGDNVTAHQLVALTDHPRTVLFAAVTEIAALAGTVARHDDVKPVDLWRHYCAQWETPTL